MPFAETRVLITSNAECMALKNGVYVVCDKKKQLRLTNERFPRGLFKTATVIPIFANAKMLCRFK
jgi:hypothetical protein